jgi:uncharacterized protein (DUF58 family)
MTQPVPGKVCVVSSLWSPVLGAVGLFAFAVVTHAVWPQLLACALVGLVGASLVGMGRQVPVDVEIELPDRVVVGRPFETRLQVTHRGSGPSRPLVVRHRLATAAGSVPHYATMIGTLAGHESVVVRATRTPRTRGVIETSYIEIDAVAPFGFFSRRAVIEVSQRVLVLPASALAIALPQSIGIRSGTVGATGGLDAGAVRAWRPGDQVRNVEWRSTARTGRLTVLDREDLSAGSLVAVLVGTSGEPAFESALAIATATAVAALHQGRIVDIVTSDGHIRCSSIRAEAALLEFFARVERAEPLSDASLDQVLRSCGRGGTLFVALAPATFPDWRTRLGAHATTLGVRVVDVASTVSETRRSL